MFLCAVKEVEKKRKRQEEGEVQEPFLQQLVRSVHKSDLFFTEIVCSFLFGKCRTTHSFFIDNFTLTYTF